MALAGVLVAAALALSGGSSSDPRTPAALPGLPPPYLTAAVVGSGGATAGIDAYGTVVDLRLPGPAGRPLIDNPADRQAAGTVEPGTGIAARVSIGGGPPLPGWRADSVRQEYLAGTNVLRTMLRFGGARAEVVCAARAAELACASGGHGGGPAEVSFAAELEAGRGRVRLGDERSRLLIRRAAAADRAWLAGARPLSPAAPAWARDLYGRSLLVLRASTDRRTGAVAAGARDRWAFVWPRDAGAVAIALAAAGYGAEARRVARFLLGLDLDAAARFDGAGDPVEGRDAQGDAAGWVAAAARAAGLRLSAARRRDHARYEWRDRADYQEVSAGNYLGNAIAAGATRRSHQVRHASHGELDAIRFVERRGLVRAAEDAGSGLDSVAAWAVRPFTRPELFPAARRTLLTLAGESGRFGIVPSESWPHADPWTAPTAWTAWSLAALGERREALRLLAALRRAATPAGLLPERVGARSGVPASTTPLAWSHAFAILALRELYPRRDAGTTGDAR